MILLQIAYIPCFYLLGVLFGLIFHRQLPTMFIAVSGFIWGSLIWVLAVGLIYVSPLVYTFEAILGILAVFSSGLLIWHIRHRNWKLKSYEIVVVGAVAMTYLFVSTIALDVNLSAASPDSLTLILTGRMFASENFPENWLHQIADRGFFVAPIQSLSLFLEIEYLPNYQPSLALTLLLTFVYVSYRASTLVLEEKQLAIPLTLLVTAALVSTFFFRWQAFYIHSNFTVSVYLFTGISTLWLGLVEDNKRWFVFGVLSMLAVSILRVESPLFVFAFLSLFAVNSKLTYRDRLVYILPCAISIVLWSFLVFMRFAPEEGVLLTRARSLLLLIVAAAFCIFLVFSNSRMLKRYLFPRLYSLMIIGGIALLILSMFVDPTNLRTSVVNTLLNTTWFDWWGVTWIMFFPIMLLSFLLPALEEGRFLSNSIVVFFLLMFIIVLARNPYREGWGDSGNRMLVHILPVIMFYFMLKFAAALPTLQWHTTLQTLDPPKLHSRWRILLPIIAGLIVVYYSNVGF